jgi:hypothetical protein
MPSALDEVFGERNTADMPTIVTRTNWPEAEESIRPILDKFDELQGGTPQSPKIRKERRGAAREWYAEFGINLDLLGACWEKLKDGGMTVATERSLIKTALDLRMKINKRPPPDICPECGAAYGTHTRGCKEASGEDA